MRSNRYRTLITSKRIQTLPIIANDETERIDR